MNRTANKPVIFLAFANDRDDAVGYLRNLPQEARQLRNVLDKLGLCEVVVRSNCTATDIFKVFQDSRYRNRIAIFHYGGHANGYQLLLESAQGEVSIADGEGFAQFLAEQNGLELVFLNGCSTQQHAQRLVDADISAVISTSRAIDDTVATEFSKHFYQGLASGASIKTAFDEAKAAIHTAHSKDPRALYFFGDIDPDDQRIDLSVPPWDLRYRTGAEQIANWNLPDAANNPLFGLPALPEHDLPESPYRHLNWFQSKHAELFFGRDRQIRDMYNRLTSPESDPILLFYGQSGVGKSSLLHAGVVPRLEATQEVRYLRRTQGGLLDTLSLAFLPEAAECSLESAWQYKEKKLGRPLIVIIDQVEEMYTRSNEGVDEQLASGMADELAKRAADELAQFLKQVRSMFHDRQTRPRGKLVLGFRKEWLADLESRLSRFELPRSHFFLEPLDQQGIIEAVQGPTRSNRLRNKYGLTIEEGLARTIATKLNDEGSSIAPPLQILLTKMWDQVSQNKRGTPHFDAALYEKLDRQGIMLEDFLVQQIAAFSEKHKEAAESGLLLDLVETHTTPLGTAAEIPEPLLLKYYAHRKNSLPTFLSDCQNLYLLTEAESDGKKGSRIFRLTHDTLAPLIRKQFEISDKPGQRARRILNNRGSQWADGKRGALLDSTDLKLVESGRSGTRALSPDEQRLLKASKVRWLIRTGVTCVLGVALLAALVFGWVMADRAIKAKNNAIKASDIARESVRENLDLYQTINRHAGCIAAAETASEAQANFELLRTSERVSSSDISTELDALEYAIEGWKENDTDWAAGKACRVACLGLVKITYQTWDTRLVASSTDNTLKDRRRLEAEILLEGNVIQRAIEVTSKIASAAKNNGDMYSYRREFERLYWAELYFVELKQVDWVKKEVSAGSPIEKAMVDFRKLLNGWNLEGHNIESDKLLKQASLVGHLLNSFVSEARLNAMSDSTDGATDGG